MTSIEVEVNLVDEKGADQELFVIKQELSPSMLNGFLKAVKSFFGV